MKYTIGIERLMQGVNGTLAVKEILAVRKVTVGETPPALALTFRSTTYLTLYVNILSCAAARSAVLQLWTLCPHQFQYVWFVVCVVGGAVFMEISMRWWLVPCLWPRIHSILGSQCLIEIILHAASASTLC
jgi:hypothetical protein